MNVGSSHGKNESDAHTVSDKAAVFNKSYTGKAVDEETKC